jgi:LAS superfamily LD-carboxypeptidase LdcB
MRFAAPCPCSPRRADSFPWVRTSTGGNSACWPQRRQPGTRWSPPYRSVDYQEKILRKKLDKGQAIDDILQVSAAPGFSEHHSGRAVDVTTPGYPVLEEVFEDSEAFTWLSEHAGTFGFRLSYPRDNRHGVAYEPWHWAWRGDR